ncbi:TPA: hypothetical protein K8M70_000290 [Clostridium perfringens]|nr:hypothetical protein [Clostridium perfringens]HBI7034774.1 hypothetical protein [Clostridium perfringens]HBI7048867.1 hypothetical protein [Clostridium perfringens]
MNKIAYKCSECGIINVFDEGFGDGERCLKCGGFILPIGEARVKSRHERVSKLKIEIDSNKLKKVLAPILNLNNYRIIFKEEFMKEFLYMNEPYNVNGKILNERWEKISKGYNFIIGIGEHYYSVEYFNKLICDKDAKESM